MEFHANKESRTLSGQGARTLVASATPSDLYDTHIRDLYDTNFSQASMTGDILYQPKRCNGLDGGSDKKKKKVTWKKEKAGVVLQLQGGKRHGQYLLVKGRDYDVKGKWGFPKGQLEGDETPLNCAYREFKEETGQELDTTSGISFTLETTDCVFYYVRYRLPYFCVDIKIDGKEIIDYNFFTLQQIRNMRKDINLYTRMFFDQEGFIAPVNERKVLTNFPLPRLMEIIYEIENTTFEAQMGFGKQVDNDCQFNELIQYITSYGEEDSSSDEEEFFIPFICKIKDTIVEDYQMGYGYWINDHCPSMYTIHTHGCDENCTGCYPGNSSAIDYLDERVRWYWYDQHYYETYDICTCDAIELCDMHYKEYCAGYESQMVTLLEKPSNETLQNIEQQAVSTVQYSQVNILGPLEAQLLKTNKFISKQKGYSKFYNPEIKEFQLQQKQKTKNNKEIFDTFGNGVIYCTNLRKYFKTLRHGEKRRVLQQLLCKINYNMDTTYLRNDKDDFMYIIRLLKQYKLKYTWTARKFEKFVAQGFFDMIIPTTIKDTIQNANDTMNKVNDAADTVTYIGNMISNLKGMLVPFAGGVWSAMCKVFIQFISAGYLLSQKCNQTVTNVAAIIMATLSGMVPLNDLIDQLILAVKAVVMVTAQAPGVNLVVAIGNIFVYLFKSIFSVVDSAATAKFNIHLEIITKINKAIMGMKNIVDMFVTIISNIFEYFGDYLIGYYGYLPSFLRGGGEELENLVEQYKEFELSNYSVSASSNAAHANFVVDLHTKLMNLEEQMLKSTLVKKDRIIALPYIRTMRSKVKEVVDNLPPQLRNMSVGRRSKPFWLGIVGEPRIGKSTWLQNFIITMLAKQQKLVTKFQDPSVYAFTRTCGAEFWDGYAQHPVLLYDDLFQVYADEQTVMRGIDELTKVVNDAIYQLNMSQAQEKKGHYMVSKIVISNMQNDFVGQKYISDKCLSAGLHLYARRNAVVKLHVNPKYMTPQGIVNSDFMKNSINWNEGDHLIYKIIPKDAYSLEFFNPKDGSNQIVPSSTPWVENGITYNNRVSVPEGLLYILQLSDKFFSAGMDIGALVNDVCQEYFLAQMYNPIESLAGSYASVASYNAEMNCVSPTTMECFTCDYTGDARELEKHYDTAHGYYGQCKFCIYRTPEISNLIQHIYQYHKLPCVYLEDFKMYCKYCDKYTDILDGHKCMGQVLCDSKTLVPLVRDAQVYAGRYIDYLRVPVSIVDNKTIQLFNDTLLRNEKMEYVNYIETLCKKCCDNYYDMLVYNEEAYGPVIRKLSHADHVHAETWEEFIYEQPIQIESFADKAKKVIQTYLFSWREFMKSTTFVAIGGIVAIAAVIGVVWSFTKPNESLETHAGSSHKDARRAKNTRLRSKGKNKQSRYGVDSIHEIDNRPVNIGHGYKAELYNNSNVTLEQTVARNIGIIQLVLEDTGVRMIKEAAVAFVNLWGSVFAIPRHFAIRVKQLQDIYIENKKQIKISLSLTWSRPAREHIVPYEDIVFIDPLEQLEDSGHLTDVMYFYVPGLASGRDITGHFVSIDDEVNLYGSYLYGHRSAVEDKTIQLLNVSDVELLEKEMTYFMTAAPDPLFKLQINQKKLTIPQFYWYRSTTIGGDCGMLLMHTDQKIQRKILGIHVAGSSVSGISNPMYKEDLDDLRELLKINFECQACIYKPIEELINYKDNSANPTFANEIVSLVDSNGIIKSVLVEENEFYIRPNIPTRTSIVPSVMYDTLNKELGAPYTQPARLAPFENRDGQIISPFLKAFKKMQNNSRYIEQKYRKEIVDNIVSTIINWKSTVKSDFTLLNEYEVFNGRPGLNPIDVTTSGGYPFKVMTKDIGKKGFINTIKSDKGNIYEPTEQLRRLMNNRENDARMGKITETIFLDTLKDETRDISKVEEGKTRMFQIGPMDLLLLTRKYCGAFVAHCHTTYLDGEMAIGINPYCDDWDIIARRMLIFNKFLNGDFSNYDSTIGLSMAWMIIDIINEIYDDGPENKLIRAVLLLTCFCSFHMAYDVIYESLQGNPSGCLLTTIFNCLVNMILIRLVYLECTGWSLSDFHMHVRPYFYGDDNLIGLSDTISQYITMSRYAEIVRKYGFTYTTTDKSTISLDFYSFDQVSFLTNTFTYIKDLGDRVPVHKYLALLDMETIHDICFWSRSDPTNMIDQLNRVNMSLYYLRNHGKGIFEVYRRVFIKCVRNANKKGFVIKENEVWDWRRVNQLYDKSSIAFLDLLSPDESIGDTLLRDGMDVIILKKSLNLEHNCSELPEFITTNNQILYAQMGWVPEKHPQIKLDSFVLMNDKTTQTGSVALPRLPMRIKRYTDNVITQTRIIVQSDNYFYFSNEPCNAIKNVSTQTDMYITQMDVETVTTFVEEKPVVDMNPTQAPEVMASTAKTEDLDAFIKRPVLIGTYAWTAAQTVGTNIFSIILPNAIYNNANFQAKLNRFAFWAPDFEVTLRVNGTGLHYGRLVAFWAPQAQSLSPAYFNYKTAFTHRWEQIDANSTEDITIRIPYTYYSDQITVGRLSDDIATLYVNVAAPLSMVTGTASSIFITAFVRCIEPRLAGFNYYNDYVAQMGIYSDVAREGGKFSVALTNAVGLSWMSAPLKKYSGLVANVLEYLGYSTPVNKSSTMPMQIMQPRLQKVIDNPNATNLAISQDYAVEDTMARTNGYENEIDIATFCSRPCLLYLGRIASTNVSGDILYSVNLTPGNMAYYDYTAAPASPFAPLPVCYFGWMHQYWRGSMKFTLSFIASNFHNCRVRINYIPYKTSNYPSVTEITGGDTENLVLDLSVTSEVSFTIPYMQTTDWRSTNVIDTQESTNGTLQIQLINPLTSGYTTVNPIYYQLFMSMCDDLQFSCPSLEATNGEYYIAEMGTRVSNVQRTYACSMTCLQKAPAVCLGKPLAHLSGCRDMTNIVPSVLSLAKMATYFETRDLDVAAIEICPWTQWAVKDSGTRGSLLGKGYLGKMEAIFRYKKGGYRLTVLPITSIENGVVKVGYRPKAGSAQIWNPTPTTSQVAFSAGMSYHNVLSRNPIDVVIPYNAIWKCICNAISIYSNRSNYWTPSVVIYGTGGSDSVDTYISAADDYRLMFQLGIPVVSL